MSPSGPDNSAPKGRKKTKPGSAWKRVNNAFDAGSRLIEVVLSVAFVLAVLLNFVTAADRYFFKHSIIGSDEFQTYIMVWMTFAGAAVVSWRHRHLRMDVLLVRLPRPIRTALLVIEHFLIFGLTGVLASRSFDYAAQMYLLDRRSDLAGLPMWIPHGALFVGFSLIALISALRLFGLFTHHAELEGHPTEAAL